MTSLKTTIGFAAALGASVAGASAQNLNSFGDGVEGAYKVGTCPDVVVVDIPFCTDECGQVLREQRAAAVREAFAKADLNGDGNTNAFVTAYASRIATTEYNQALSQRRVNFATDLAREAGATVRAAAAFGESKAKGTKVANFPSDRYARIYFAEDQSDIVKQADGDFAPAAGVRVIGFEAPACNR
jgi:hypothetical protein